jgi:hypothetical protein
MVSRWNFVDISYRTGDLSTSGLAATIFDFQLPVAYDSVVVSLNERLNPENEGSAIEISLLFCVEAEMISGNFVYMRFSKVLLDYGRHIGYPVIGWSEIFTPTSNAKILKKSHESISVNFSGCRTAPKSSVWRVIYPHWHS